MHKLYVDLDDAVDRITKLSGEYNGIYVNTPDDKTWLRNELEQVCELRVCDLCRGVEYTSNPFTVITQMGREVKTVFNFCPACGRDLMPEKEINKWGEHNEENSYTV